MVHTCGATTRNGGTCRRVVAYHGERCWQHHESLDASPAETLEAALDVVRRQPAGAIVGTLRQDRSAVLVLFTELGRLFEAPTQYPGKTHWATFFVHGADFVGACTMDELQDQLRAMDAEWHVKMGADGADAPLVDGVDVPPPVRRNLQRRIAFAREQLKIANDARPGA